MMRTQAGTNESAGDPVPEVSEMPEASEGLGAGRMPTLEQDLENYLQIARMLLGTSSVKNGLDSSVELESKLKVLKARARHLLENTEPLAYWKEAVPVGTYQKGIINQAFRECYIKRQGFCAITSELVSALGDVLEGQRVLEVGCGRGTLAYAVKDRFPGLLLTAVDSGTTNNPHGLAPSLPFVIQADAVEYLKEHKNGFDTILMVWPPYENPFAFEIAKAMRPGMRLVHCFEECTGDRQFYSYLSKHFTEVPELSKQMNQSHYRFAMIRDSWEVCEKNQ